jgi:hypothetical protein
VQLASADGECLRVTAVVGGQPRELVLMPRGKPDTPIGRKAQCRSMEQRIRAATTR